MLKLNVCCSLIPSPRQATLGASYRSWIIRYHRAQKLSPLVSVKALKDDTNGGTSSFPGRSWEPGLEIEVPFEQRPVSLLCDCKHSFYNCFMQIHILVSYNAFEDVHNFLAKKRRKACMLQMHTQICMHQVNHPLSMIQNIFTLTVVRVL